MFIGQPALWKLLRKLLLEITLGTYEVKFLSHFLLKLKAIRNIDSIKLKVLPLKHDDMQYSASVQFYPGSYGCEVVDPLSHARPATTKIIPRVEIRQKNLSVDRITKHLEFCGNGR